MALAINWSDDSHSIDETTQTIHLLASPGGLIFHVPPLGQVENLIIGELFLRARHARKFSKSLVRRLNNFPNLKSLLIKRITIRYDELDQENSEPFFDDIQIFYENKELEQWMCAYLQNHLSIANPLVKSADKF